MSFPAPTASAQLEGTVWPPSPFAIQEDVEWYAENLLLHPPKAPPKRSEWRLRITTRGHLPPRHHVTRDVSHLEMYLQFAFEWLPPGLDRLLESVYHPQSRALAVAQ